jgi:anti-anti-sigma factor
MEITRRQAGDWVELHVKGRLDGYWSSDFKNAINELIHGGTHYIRIHLADVTYLSSAGLGVLLAAHKQLTAIRGKLEIANPSAAVKEVLVLSRVDALLGSPEPVARSAEAGVARTAMHYAGEQITFAVFHLNPEARMTCRLLGDPDRLPGCDFGEASCRKLKFPAATLAVGLGAMGSDFADCQGRFGEFLAAAGAAAYLPTDGSNVPDYQLAAGDAVPELHVCYGALCEGPIARLVRFEADLEVGPIALTKLLHGCLDLLKTERIGFVILAETAGLMGAALKRSPALGGAGVDLFTYPQVRDWLSFTAERAYPHSLALIVGIAAQGDGGPLAKFVRPLGREGLVGHCHAAAFSYRPLPRGEIDLRTSVASLFENLTFQGILHLLADERPTVGLGESNLLRGACWFSPLGEVVNQ